MKTEGEFQKKFVDAMREDGAVVFNFTGNQYTGAGIPDLYVCHWRFKGWIELKAGFKHKVTEPQRITIEELSLRGDVAFVLWLHDGLIHLLEPGDKKWCQDYKIKWSDAKRVKEAYLTEGTLVPTIADEEFFEPFAAEYQQGIQTESKYRYVNLWKFLDEAN